jgi:hypothetical protein
MKKAKLKIDYFTCSSDATIKDIFKKGDILTYDKKLKMYYRKETNSLSTYPEIFIEKNTDIFEIFEEPEPQEEVIEGTAYTCCEKHIGFFLKNNRANEQKEIPARLILNPKKKKEYVGYLSKKGLSEMQRGETPMYISMNKDKNYYIEITITVEEE